MILEVIALLNDKLISRNGTFFSAIDADSEGQEGKYYLWTAEELKNILGDDYDIFSHVYNVREDGNYIEEPRGISNGKNILYLENEKQFTNELTENGLYWLDKGIRRDLELLKERREKRIPPQTDTKICADMNGFMLYALSEAYDATDDPRIYEMAMKLYLHLSKNYVKGGKCTHIVYESGRKVDGYFSDYAFLALGFFRFGFSSGEDEPLTRANEIVERLSFRLKSEMNILREKGMSNFIGTLNSQEDSSIPSQFSVYEKVMFYSNLSGNFADFANLTTKESVENLKNYPSYFTFRMQTILEEKRTYVLKWKLKDSNNVRIVKMKLKDGGVNQILFMNDPDTPENLFSLCSSTSCVLKDAPLEEVIKFMIDHK